MPGRHRSVGQQIQRQDWSRWPYLCYLGNHRAAGEPIVHHSRLLAGPRQSEHFWDEVIGRQDAVIVDESLRVAPWVVGAHLRHVAGLALQVAPSIAVPRTGFPVVVLVL